MNTIKNTDKILLFFGSRCGIGGLRLRAAAECIDRFSTWFPFIFLVATESLFNIFFPKYVDFTDFHQTRFNSKLRLKLDPFNIEFYVVLLDRPEPEPT